VIDRGNVKKEKKLFWSKQAGFVSENSDDEQVKLQRFKLASAPKVASLRQRAIRPFETLLLEHLGGYQIFRDILDKDLSEVQSIFHWDQPNPDLTSFGDFLMC